jgi:FkbM family methyltransferase
MKFISNIVKQNDYCLDVGANIGYYSCLMGALIGDKGKVFAFEPVRYNRELLNLNIILNRLNNITVCSNGLGESKRKIDMKIYPEDSFLTGHSSLVENEVINKNQFYETHSINLVTIDEYLEKNQIERVDVVKIDIEGYEYFFFQGAQNLINEYKPIIIFEHNPDRIKHIGLKEKDFKKIFENYIVYELFDDGLIRYNFNGNIKATDLVAIPKVKTEEILCTI